MEQAAFQRRATELGQPQRAVPEVESSGVGNPPVDPAQARQYVAETRARMTPEGQAAFPREPMPPLTLLQGGRATRQGVPMMTREMPPAEREALQRLITENLLEGPQLGRSGVRAPQGMSQGRAQEMIANDLAASAEVQARVQRHAPGGRFKYWEQRLGKKQTVPRAQWKIGDQLSDEDLADILAEQLARNNQPGGAGSRAPF